MNRKNLSCLCRLKFDNSKLRRLHLICRLCQSIVIDSINVEGSGLAKMPGESDSTRSVTWKDSCSIHCAGSATIGANKAKNTVRRVPSLQQLAVKLVIKDGEEPATGSGVAAVAKHHLHNKAVPCKTQLITALKGRNPQRIFQPIAQFSKNAL